MRSRANLFYCFSWAPVFLLATAGIVPKDLFQENVTALNQDILGGLAGNGAALLAATCRWTNCNQDCPTGFVEIPRLSIGQPGEIISEHIQCGGNGRSKICCPPDPDQTKCEWKGFNNFGSCKPGCGIKAELDGGVEAGTTLAGCTHGGYQSVCCTTPASELGRAGVVVYTQCGWYSKYKKKKTS